MRPPVQATTNILFIATLLLSCCFAIGPVNAGDRGPTALANVPATSQDGVAQVGPRRALPKRFYLKYLWGHEGMQGGSMEIAGRTSGVMAFGVEFPIYIYDYGDAGSDAMISLLITMRRIIPLPINGFERFELPIKAHGGIGVTWTQDDDNETREDGIGWQAGLTGGLQFNMASSLGIFADAGYQFERTANQDFHMFIVQAGVVAMGGK
jgi:hypothetical protein